MSLAFWSIQLTQGKPVEVQPPEGYVLNIQQAAVEGAPDKSVVIIRADTLSIEDEKISGVVLGTLRPGHVDQVSLGLVFGYEVPVTFTVSGTGNKGIVHLTGYFQPGPDGDMDEDDEFGDEDDEDDEDEDEDEPPQLTNTAASVKAATPATKASVAPVKKNEKVVAAEEEEDDDDDEDDGDDEDDEVDGKFIQKMIQKSGGKIEEKDDEDDDDDEDDEDDDEEDDEDDEDDEDEEDEPPIKKGPAAGNNKPTTPGGSNKPAFQGKPNTPGGNKPNTPGGKPFGGNNSKPNTPGGGFKGNNNNNNSFSGNKNNNNNQNRGGGGRGNSPNFNKRKF